MPYGTQKQWDYVDFIESYTVKEYEGKCYDDLVWFITEYKGMAYREKKEAFGAFSFNDAVRNGCGDSSIPVFFIG